MSLSMTRHATGRSKERGISQETIDVLLDFGTYRHNGRGTMVVAMDAAGRAEARRQIGRDYDRVAQRLDFAAIVADGAVLTVVPRSRRLKLGPPHRRSRLRRRTRRNQRPRLHWGRYARASSKATGAEREGN